jgi:hypothetical protein
MKSYYCNLNSVKTYYLDNCCNNNNNNNDTIINIQQQIDQLIKDIEKIKKFTKFREVIVAKQIVNVTVKTFLRMNYVRYIIKHGVPDDGIFDLDLLAESGPE